MVNLPVRTQGWCLATSFWTQYLFRKGSRMAGPNIDLASNPTGKFGKSAINQFETSRSPFPFSLPRIRSDSILIPSNEVSNRSHSILSLTQTVSRPINSGSFLQLQILINDVSVTGTIDTAASCSVISKDLAMSCSMEFVTDSVEYLSANNVTTSSLGSARGVLTFRLGNIANLVRVSHSLPVIPGSNILLIGTDILTFLGLLNEDGVFIKLNREHSVILQDEAKFDHLIPITTADELSPDQISADFLSKLTESDCEITLDDPNKQTRLIKVLESFSEVFQSKPHPDGIDCPPMEIPFHSEDAVVKMKPRNLNPNKLRIARDIFTDLVNSGFAYFTKDSKFGSPIVLVTYPDHRKPRLTGDFSGATGVNANTKTVVPNLPKISDILEFLSSAQFIGTLDLPKAFWQLNVATKDQEKTTLVIPGMSIAFRRACFGLKNVPAIFQNIMMEIFDIPGVFIYIDDVIIADSSFDGFLDKIRTVLHRAKLKRVNLGLNKCRFSSSNHPVKILGHVFLNKTRFIDSSRIDALNDLPRPTTLKEVRSFIGSINYLRDWLPDISSLIAPIINLTKGSPKSISWTPALDNLFVKIKSMIANHIPLTLPDQEGNILISTDASDIAVGGVVWLERPPCAAAGTKLIDRKVLPLSFYSKILSNSQKNWSVFQKELYAILLILTESTLSSFLRSRHLTIFMDHQNIAFLYSAPEKNRIVKRWIPILADFDFDIEHTKGEDNHWADMLSRFVPQHLSTDKARNPDFPRDPISIPSHSPSNVLHDSTPLKIMCLKAAISQDLPVFDHLLSKIRSEQKIALTNKDPLFVEATWNEKYQLLLNQEGKIVIPDNLRQTILLNIHGLVQSGHPSLRSSISRLKESHFFWPSMVTDMEDHVRRCPACQKTAPIPSLKVPSSGSLWADRPFSRLNVDTIGPLPKDIQDHQFVLVFVDSFTRYTILVPLKKLNALETAYALVWNVCAIFGIPLCIHSDNGPEFANAVFRGVCDQLAIEYSNSIPHYSQSNGLVERRHRDILQSLRKLLIDFNDYDNWATYIPVVQLLINAEASSATGHTPYELMFGSSFSSRSDPTLILKAMETTNSSSSLLKEYQLKLNRILEKREEAKKIQNSKLPQPSKHPNNFRPGDLVLRHSKSSKKLHGSYLGPFLVIEAPSSSSVTLQNLITGTTSTYASRQCKLYQTDLPDSSDLHKAVASGDSEEHLVSHIISVRDTPDGPLYSVQWFGGEISEVSLDTIKNTKAFADFQSLHRPPPLQSPPRKRARTRKGSGKK
ncbi:hypothetical protein RCL1_005720 [Eukaryota sp. TZLM3-RCL]